LKAVFFDRDGLSNRDNGYAHRWEDFKFTPGSIVALCRNFSKFLQSFGVMLSADNHCQRWAPPSCSHDFVVISDSTEFLYKTTDYRPPQFERNLLWNDSTVHVKWPMQDQLQWAVKDAVGKPLADPEMFT